MATARLRRTFQYPSEMDSDDEGPEAMDEEEQESLIQNLQQENITRNKQYTTLLLILTLTTTLPYLTTLFVPQITLLSFLSISSLLSTAYLTSTYPPNKTGIAFLDALNMSSEPQSLAARKEALMQAGGGPVKMFLPYLNMALCVVLVGLGGVVKRRGGGLWWGFEWLPASVYTVVLVAKWVMGSVDPEGELGGLKYQLKGA
ncbi:uncharacterized protein RSE6_04204 [Rhynchosporium secalis]|uniref:Uncharacterized protein n=1 Tax=Rhynchosporium secalis TaxID=38038 RepID=A0A1E1M4N9_RHYSE|nr:uncharacterized protein RSE6_04204 [Rhynchosporium secalis]